MNFLFQVTFHTIVIAFHLQELEGESSAAQNPESAIVDDTSDTKPNSKLRMGTSPVGYEAKLANSASLSSGRVKQESGIFRSLGA